MAPEIPTQFQFEELLTNTFPGFFTAITLFMLIDIWSPINLASWVSKDITSLVSLIGFVFLFGTILGVIVDGIHHSIVETIFKQSIGIKEKIESLNALYPYPNEELKLGATYFFKTIGENALDIHYYPIKSIYFYSEFYANAFISVVPFSFVISFYLFKVLQISWTSSLIFALVSLITASVCLHRSFMALKDYYEARFSIICGYLDYRKYMNPMVYLFSWDEVPGKDTVRLKEFLKHESGIDWVETAKIGKIDDGRTIRLSSENNYLLLKLNNKKTKANLKIDDGRTDEFIAKMENGKLNIYAGKDTIFKKECTIVATIKCKASKIPVPEKDIEVIFRTTLGDITPINDGKTDNSGVARATLNSNNKCGTAIVTTTSKDCIPGVIKVQFRRLY